MFEQLFFKNAKSEINSIDYLALHNWEKIFGSLIMRETKIMERLRNKLLIAMTFIPKTLMFMKVFLNNIHLKL